MAWDLYNCQPLYCSYGVATNYLDRQHMGQYEKNILCKVACLYGGQYLGLIPSVCFLITIMYR